MSGDSNGEDKVEAYVEAEGQEEQEEHDAKEKAEQVSTVADTPREGVGGKEGNSLESREKCGNVEEMFARSVETQCVEVAKANTERGGRGGAVRGADKAEEGAKREEDEKREEEEDAEEEEEDEEEEDAEVG